jgi:hypothetical protein
MEIIDDSCCSKIVGRSIQLSSEDATLCGLVVNVNENCEEESDRQDRVKKLQLSMIQRIFYPGRFGIHTIMTVLASDVPILHRNNLLLKKDQDDLLASCVGEVRVRVGLGLGLRFRLI